MDVQILYRVQRHYQSKNSDGRSNLVSATWIVALLIYYFIVGRLIGEKTEMKFKDLINSTEWPEICDVLTDFYPDSVKNIEGYEQVFKELLTLSLGEEVDVENMRIVFEHWQAESENPKVGYETHVSVNGNNGTLWEVDKSKDHAEVPEQRYGLEFVPWENWLSMEVDAKALSEFSTPEIVAHCIWEMTFFGFSQSAIDQKGMGFAEMVKGIVEKNNE